MNAPACPQWLTYEEAGALTGLSSRQLRRHIKAGKIGTEKHGRRLLLCRADLAPYTPTAPCEVVPVTVGDHTIEGLRFGEEGEEVIATRLIEQTLGYDEGSLRDLIRRAWADEFEEGTHYRLLDSSEMGALSRTLHRDDRQGVRLPSLHVLTEQGVALVLMKSGKQAAARLRAALAETGFMRSVARAVMAGDPQQLAGALSGDSTPAWVGALLQRQDARLDRLETLVLRLVENQSTSPQAPALPQHSSDYHDPIMRAEEVCKMLAARYPELRDKPQAVHTIAKRCGLVDPLNGSGDPRYTRRVVLAADRGPTRFFSPAAVDEMAIFLRGEGRLDFTGGGR